MSMTDIINLRRRLSAKQFWPINRMASVNKAFELVSYVEIPFRLQHLACRTVAHTMSHKSLGSISTLGLPNRIQQYVLLK